MSDRNTTLTGTVKKAAMGQYGPWLLLDLGAESMFVSLALDGVK